MKYTTLQPKVVIQEYEKDQAKHLLLLSKIKKLLRVLTVRKTQKKNPTSHRYIISSSIGKLLKFQYRVPSTKFRLNNCAITL